MSSAPARPLARPRARGRGLRGLLAGAAIVALAAAGLVPASPAAAATLTNLGLSASNPVRLTTGVTYTWTFTLATSANLTSMTFTLPTGSGGTPTTATAVGDAGYAITFPTGTPTRSGLTVTVPITSATWGPAGTKTTVTVAGLTNTTTVGDYPTTITTYNGVTPIDTATGGSLSIVTAAATNPYWTPSSAVTSAAGTTYSVRFTTATTATLASVVITGPPGVAGTPTLVSAAGVPGTGTVSLSGTTLTYAFAATSVASGTTVTLVIGGITNPPTAGSYSLYILTRTASAPVNAVRTDAIAFTSGALGSPVWAPDRPTTAATGVSYTYTFGIGTSQYASRFVVQLPVGTVGTPTLVSLSASGPGSNPFTGGSVSRSGTTLTVDFTEAYLQAGWVVTIVVGSMTNTSTAGSYPALITSWRVSAGTAIDSGVAPAVPFAATSIVASWGVTNAALGATSVSYRYDLSFSAATTIRSVTMTVPAGTAGTPTVGTVLPAALAGGTASLSGTTLTYTLPSNQSVATAADVQIVIDGLTNTSTAGSTPASVTAWNATPAVVAAGTTPPVGFAADALVNPSWSPSTQQTNTASTYTFALTTPVTPGNASSITFTLPYGTTGTPALGAVSAVYSGGPLSFSGTSVARAGTTLTFSFASMYLQPSTVISVVVTGLTNTATAGAYSSAITVFNGPNATSAGVTPAVGLGTVTATGSWAVGSSVAGATGVAYTYGITIGTTTTVSSITMTLPAGTGGTPAVVAVAPTSPAGFTGGVLTRTGDVLTYAFTASSLTAGTVLSITVSGMTNTAVGGDYVSTLTLRNATTTVIAGATSPPVSFTSSVLAGVTWGASSTTIAVTGVTYTWGFTTTTTGTLSEVTFSVPAGTGGTPSLVSATTAPSVTLGGAAVTMTGTTVKLSFTGVYVPAGTAFTVVVSGFANTSTTGIYAASIVTRNAGVARESGVSTGVPFVPANTATLTWAASGLVAGTPSITETFVYKTGATATHDRLILTLPAGTSGTPTIVSLSPPAVTTGAAIALSGSTLTLTFTSTSLTAGTVINLQVGGLTQTIAAGTYTVVGSARQGGTQRSTATSGPLTVVARTATATVTCAATNACRTLPNGSTQLEIVLIPGAATPVVAPVQLTVSTNAPSGYVVGVASTPLTSGASVIPQASTSGAGSIAPDRFGATAALTPGGVSGATLCGAYAGGWAQIGYPVSATSLFAANAATGATTDTVVVSNTLRVSAVQPAGTYTGTITYTVQPRYTAGSGC